MPETRKRAASYIWASRPEERTGLQTAEFIYVAHNAGWKVVAHYKDIGGERPEFDRMMRDTAERKFDVLMAWSIERLGRNLRDLVATLGQLQTAGVDLYLKEQTIDTTTPEGQALFQMAGIFADAEGAMRRQHLRAGIARARQSGKRLGRPQIDSGRAAAIRASLASGLSIRKAAKQHGVGISTVQRLKKGEGSHRPSGDASGRSLATPTETRVHTAAVSGAK
jgi:DNA invertase Pin-like site-specific DNA recombinase